ncbi:MAG: hypothetical protein JW894_15220 [Bacteroidales bacterium]|nr:hypothetical protein [Bacteroidales bacterium]
MKRNLFLLTFVSLILASSCELFQDEPPRDFVPDEPDAAGNLLIINNSNERLVLYKDEYIVKRIPASATDYLVNIPNPNEGTVELVLYLWEDVKDDPNNPPLDKVFKKWLVPLANSTDVEDRATWHISGASQYTTVATINFSYYGGTDEFVDIYLNSRTGAKIMTMMPGQQYKKVGVDYGNYTLHYLYWFSDQNDAQGFEELGWIETEMINGSEEPIWLVLNESRKDVTVIVPHLGALQNTGTKYGNVRITNRMSYPVQIYAGDKLIEDVCYLEGGIARNLSTIDNDGTYTFILPIYEEEAIETDYILSAKHITNGTVVETETITVVAEETVDWIVDGIADTEQPVEPDEPAE